MQSTAPADPADRQLLTAASDDFTAQIKIPQEGHFAWKWVAKDLWSQEITMGDYRQLSIRKWNTLYISRNAAFTPLRITELQDLLNVFSVEPDYWQLKKAKHQVQGGIEAECIEIRARSDHHVWNPRRTLCINQTTTEVLTDETKDEQEYRRKEFTDYQPFGEHDYPRQLRLIVNGSVALRVKVNSLRESTFAEGSSPHRPARLRAASPNI
jgi:hypothetical protein